MVLRDRYDFRFRHSVSFPQTHCGGIRVLRVAHEGWGPGMHLVREAAPLLPLFVVVAGRGNFRCNGSDHPLSAGDCFSFSGKPTEVRCARRSPLEVRILVLAGDDGPAQIARLFPDRCRPQHLQDHGPLAASLAQLLTEARTDRPLRERACEHLASLSLIALERALQPETPVDARFSALQAVITREACGPLTIASLAKRCNMSPTQASRRFREHAGETLNSYRRRLRIGAACEALMAGETIEAVAERVGYSDRFALSRAFTQVMGQPPSRWLREQPVARPHRGG